MQPNYYNPFGGAYQPYQPSPEEMMRIEHEQRVRKEKSEIRQFSLGMGIAIVAFLIIQSFSVVFFSAIGLSELINTDSLFTNGFTIIFISFLSVAFPFGIMGLVFKLKKSYIYPVIPNKRIPFADVVAWVFSGLMCCVAAQFAISGIIMLFKSFGINLNTPESPDANGLFELIVELVATAIIPAICEEFAMRCCSLQLLRKYGNGFAVLAVSIVFGLLHGNIIQFIFAFTVGVILAFVTVKTDSILPAVLIHGLNNGMYCVSSFVKFYANEEAANVATVFMYIGFAVLGLVSALYLGRKGSFKSEKSAYTSVLTMGQKFSAFLFPWMIAPFIMLIVLTIEFFVTNQ